jgi:UDP-hydrolysing UDP-N-acetyl-D-glucosamine 2-epimerase
MKKKILIVTERRADYSKFRPILNEIKKSSKLDYYLVVTGSHLMKEHGHTINEIKNDGFKISAQFSMYDKKKSDTGSQMAKSFGKAVISLSRIIEEVKPDMILTGFDIGANLAAAIVGSHVNIVVGHVEGGEVSGTIDESIRHATTKFAHLHFVTNKTAANRVIKLGENPKFVFIVGNPSLDSIKQVKNIPLQKLAKEFKVDHKKPFVIILQHTVTTEIDQVDKYIKETLNAIKELNVQAMLIHGNADAGSQKISKIIRNSNIQHHYTISFEKFVNLLKNSSALIGNSSSGIMEAPFLHVPSINIGSRQAGRLRSSSVIDVTYSKNEIKNAIRKALYDKQFLEKVKRTKSLYGDGNASKKIVNILEKIDLKKIPIQKQLSY